MSRTISLVQRVEIASPCSANWDKMTGDDRARFCGECKLNVYNLSEMSEAEGEALIIAKEGKLCARIYRRADGTVLTKDCPVGWRAMRKKMVMAGVRAVAAVVFICATVGSTLATTRNRHRTIDDATNCVSYRGSMWYRSAALNGYHESVKFVQRWLVPPQMRVQVVAGALMPPPAPGPPPPPPKPGQTSKYWNDGSWLEGDSKPTNDRPSSLSRHILFADDEDAGE